MSWRSMVTGGALAMGLAVAAMPASAAVLYDNLSQQTNPLLASVAVGSSGPLGAQFMTDAFTAGVGGLELVFRGDDQSSGSFVVTIVADVGNTPDLVNPALFSSGAITDNSLTASGGYLIWDSGAISQPLSASTAYWVMVTDNAGSTVEWTYADNDSSGYPANLATLNNYVSSTVFANDGYPFVMQVECVGIGEGPCGSALSEVPEPATIGMLGAGMVALGIAIRRRRNGTV